MNFCTYFLRLDSKPKQAPNKIVSVLNYLWKNPLIKISQKEETLDPMDLGDSALSAKDDWDSCMSTYDNVLLSGSKLTQDSLMTQETELLNKFKNDYKGQTHAHTCDSDSDNPEEEEWQGENCEYICGCCEFEEGVARDNNGDVIDRFHWVHYHKNEQERFRHLKRVKKMITDWKSYKNIVRQLKKIKKLKNLLS